MIPNMPSNQGTLSPCFPPCFTIFTSLSVSKATVFSRRRDRTLSVRTLVGTKNLKNRPKPHGPPFLQTGGGRKPLRSTQHTEEHVFVRPVAAFDVSGCWDFKAWGPG